MEAASAAGRFSKAFLADLHDAYPSKSFDERKFEGLGARVNFHNRYHEGRRSAADVGLVVRRPTVVPIANRTFKIIRNAGRGLLVQAKLGNF